ncbi:unnamed protein product [Symbiodinium microadriaticum]|nr:unnamed protein product [Symbiodinium microadriaticum]
MSYVRWLEWRKETGSRPVKRRDGRPTSTAEEVALWRSVMDFLHDMTMKEEDEEEEEEEEDDEALEGACARGAACCLIADASQCSKTKLQWQSLKRVASAGVAVRLATGNSVRDAYAADGRGAVVGAGLKGLHHAKALLVVTDTTAELIVGGRRVRRPTPSADCI